MLVIPFELHSWGANMSNGCRWLFTLVFVLIASTVSAALPEGGAEIVSVQGKGESRAPRESNWREATVRQQLIQGSAVRTLDSSRMAVMLADQTQIRLAPNSMVEIKQVGDGATRATQLQQSSGRTWAQSKNIPDKLTVQTPTALAAIRGTDWELVVDEDGTSTLTVLSGTVLLSNEMGSVSIDSGEQGRAQKGVAPVKSVLLNPRSRVQWVSSFTVDGKRYPDLLQRPGIGNLLSANDLTGARRAAEQLSMQADAPASATLLLSDFLVQEGEFDQAIVTLEKGAAKFPADERFDVWRARLHLVRDDVPAARAALVSARQRNPRSTELMLAEGELERLEGNALAATAAYQSAIAQAPDTARAWHGLGVVQTEREDVVNAQTSLNRALALDPQGTGFLAELGTLEVFADRLEAAGAAFTQALQQRPDDYVALTGLALVELKGGNTEVATRHLLAASLIEPRYARAQIYLAVAYYQQGRTRDALFALARARALDPKDPLPDLYQSVIHNDQLQPGDALLSARKALSLLPYLKSLNQIANDQKGGANLGSALAAFGLEDWARSYAQDSYTPFWAGSHLFLADRYSGDFNKRSELFQGFLADPTVFGASNRFSALVAKPGDYANAGLNYRTKGGFALPAEVRVVGDRYGIYFKPVAIEQTTLIEPTLTINGYHNGAVPVAYFAEIIGTRTGANQTSVGADAKTYTIALGARPSHALGLFAYINVFDADLTLSPEFNRVNHIFGRNERLDIGANYRFGPESQAWLKVGHGRESSRANEVLIATFPNGIGWNESDTRTSPTYQDVQWRHTFALNEQQEISWGLQTARTTRSLASVQNKDFAALGYVESANNPLLKDRLDETDLDRSDDIWLAHQYRVTDKLKLESDLAWQRYRKSRDFEIARERIPPVKKVNLDTENFLTELFAPRLGFAYRVRDGAVLRGAWQKWLHPASFSTLSPVATAGIPIDDSLVNPGGQLTRTRAQLDWELSDTQFLTAYADHKSADNLNSPLDGVLNTRADVSNIDRLRQRNVANLSAPDQLEEKPVFSRGTVSGVGATFNQVLNRTLAGYVGYANTHSENTSTKYSGKLVPYLPQHRATLGLTWTGAQRMLLSAQAVWRSERFTDQSNATPLSPGWDMTLRLHWETMDKRWAVDGYVANMFNPDVARVVGVNLVGRY
jgi:Flp pilus assembly protein TadD